MIDIETAGDLLDFGARLGNDGPPLGDSNRARLQLEGAVALFNILERRRIAYLADEVGTGKTYIALGVLALLRHFEPHSRALIIAPRENIQLKWQNELQLFTLHNVRFADLRVRDPAGRPVRRVANCSRLLDLLREARLDADRDFFMRMSSFSLGMSEDTTSQGKLRDAFCAEMPWLPPELLNLRVGRDELKLRLAQAVNAGLPDFDLVIVDEAHALKHGLGRGAAARNKVLAGVLGTTEPASGAVPVGNRAKRVLLLSATPVDDTYVHLRNQFDVFGEGNAFSALTDPKTTEEERRQLIQRHLIRRVATMRVAGRPRTKNTYRREWRNGGVAAHDEAQEVVDPRSRLTLALVQKKVSEVLQDERFGASFQIGMLASFESFLATTSRAKAVSPADDVEEGDLRAAFDGLEQTDDPAAREGVDVSAINELVASHRDVFERELAHPKMDTLVERLSRAWVTGEKALVFVRRIGSVDELKVRLDDAYDGWLRDHLSAEVPERHRCGLDAIWLRFKEERERRGRIGGLDVPDDAQADAGGLDTFFSYFFRGTGPPEYLSGALLNTRLTNSSGTLATFFSDNHVMAVLDAAPGGVAEALAEALGLDGGQLDAALAESSRQYMPASSPGRSHRFEAAQAAALELLKNAGDDRASAIFSEHYARARRPAPSSHAVQPTHLEGVTFFTELRRRPDLREALWSHSDGWTVEDVRRRHLRATILSTAARLGHPLIDLWLEVIAQVSDLRGQPEVQAVEPVINGFLDRLSDQAASGPKASWGAFRELRDLAGSHDLIVDVSLSADQKRAPLHERSQAVSTLMRAQRPVAGMHGYVRPLIVRQFRLPGYPLVLVSTDLLQEGEDLHTFCSSVYHYGLAWTPSGLEQRTGRIDRLLSQTQRRLSASDEEPQPEDKLQVHYPHLLDSIERLQVRRVLRRADEFMRLMHIDLVRPKREAGSLNVSEELSDPGMAMPQPFAGELKSAFDVQPEHLEGRGRPLAVDSAAADELLRRFQTCIDRLRGDAEPVRWSTPTRCEFEVSRDGLEFETSVELATWGPLPLVQIACSVGPVLLDHRFEALSETTARTALRLGITRIPGDDQHEVLIAQDVLLRRSSTAKDVARVGAALDRATRGAATVANDRSVEETVLSRGVQRWRKLADGTSDFRPHASRAVLFVDLEGGRNHRVRVVEGADGLLLEAIVADADALQSAREEVVRAAWERNVTASMVGRRVDPRGRLLAHTWTPNPGLDRAIFRTLVRTLAQEADREELLVSGEDRQ